jgi:integral membrane protein (TIGR01906 family)
MRKKAVKSKKLLDESRVLLIISIILTVFLILAAGFFMVFFDRNFYDKEFKKYGVYDELGVIGSRITVDYLINYLTSENSEIVQREEFNIFEPEEKSHLEDVHSIIHTLKISSIAALVILILIIIRLSMLKDFLHNIKRMLIYGSAVTLVLLLVLFVLSLNFPAFFESFHKILFPQGNYAFPESYLLIKLFPEAFFNDYARKMFFHSAIISLILLFLGSTSTLAFTNPRRH